MFSREFLIFFFVLFSFSVPATSSLQHFRRSRGAEFFISQLFFERSGIFWGCGGNPAGVCQIISLVLIHTHTYWASIFIFDGSPIDAHKLCVCV
jgi:hypothetical protein